MGGSMESSAPGSVLGVDNSNSAESGPPESPSTEAGAGSGSSAGSPPIPSDVALQRRENDLRAQELALDRRDLELQRRELVQETQASHVEQSEVKTIEIQQAPDPAEPQEPEMIERRVRKGVRWQTIQEPRT